MRVESVVPTSRDEECLRGQPSLFRSTSGFVSLESETASGGGRDDRRSEHDNPGHDQQHFELRQTDHNNQAGGVHDRVVHGMEQSGDQHAGVGAVVEPASDQSAAQLREQEDAQYQRRGRP
jgi:hypothetical protein